MDVLKAEIERKRKQLTDLAQGTNKKYVKRGDIAAKQEQEYWRKHKRFVEDNATSNSEDEGRHSPAIKSLFSSTDSKTDEEKSTLLPRKEVVRRLRERNEPICLFAETDYEAFQRLRKLESLAPDINKGMENDFKAALDQVDQDYLNEIIKQAGGQVPSSDVSVKDDGTTVTDLKNMRDELGVADSDNDQEIILKFLKYILKLWGEDLNMRPENVKRTMWGKMDSATHTQTVSYLKPFFAQLKARKIDPGIFDCMVEIVRHLMDRDYIKANDAYLEMAIGNAPWPIGVTMVGIHARTGREKISSRYVAHVLNDETQRKYIQAVKRLMTQCQRFFRTDPIRSVEFERSKHMPTEESPS